MEGKYYRESKDEFPDGSSFFMKTESLNQTIYGRIRLFVLPTKMAEKWSVVCFKYVYPIEFQSSGS